MTAQRSKHVGEKQGLILLATLQDKGLDFKDEELRIFAGLTPSEFKVGTKWLEDNYFIIPDNGEPVDKFYMI